MKGKTFHDNSHVKQTSIASSIIPCLAHPLSPSASKAEKTLLNFVYFRRWIMGPAAIIFQIGHTVTAKQSVATLLWEKYLLDLINYLSIYSTVLSKTPNS